MDSYISTCRWMLSDEYMSEYSSSINVMVIITHDKGSSTGVKIDEQNLTAFTTGIVKDHKGYIIATCGREFASKIQYEQTGIERIDLKIGLLARCILTNYMSRQGVSEIYNDASNESLVRYYSTLGYRLGRNPCNNGG